MTHSMTERFTVLVCMLMSAGMGFLIHGFAKLHDPIAIMFCCFCLLLNVWTAWEIMDV